MRACINPAEIQPGDLSAYADGEAAQRVAAHVRRCAFCAGRVAIYRRMVAALAVALDRAACPEAETLGDFYLDALPAGQKLVVAKHLAACPQCAAELQAFDRPVPSADWLAGLKGLSSVLTGVLEAIRVPLRPLAVARGDTARPHYYRAGNLNISIGYRSSTAQRGVLSGVILAPASRAAPAPRFPLPVAQEGRMPFIHVTLFRHDAEVSVQPIDALGSFVFEDIPPGEYDLAFDWDERVVLVTGIRAP